MQQRQHNNRSGRKPRAGYSGKGDCYVSVQPGGLRSELRARVHTCGTDDGACSMKKSRTSLLRRIIGDERGQVLPIVALSMAGLFGVSALVIDVGHLLYSYQELQSSTNAAALAGSQA